mgnify:CR=1 FL=1
MKNKTIIAIIISGAICVWITRAIAIFVCMFTACKLIPYIFVNASGYSIANVFDQRGLLEIFVIILIFLILFSIWWGLFFSIRWVVRWVVRLIKNIK